MNRAEVLEKGQTRYNGNSLNSNENVDLPSKNEDISDLYTTVPKGMMYITIHKGYWIFIISVIHYNYHETTRLYEMIEYTR